MNYKKHYDNLINTRKELSRNKKNGIFENHHILPKCLGGCNEKTNLILLTPKEHFIAHLLLTQMYEGEIKAKMCYAFMRICTVNKKQSRKISSSQYDLAKKLMSENCRGENASFYGKKLSKEAKKSLSDRMKGDNNPSRKFGAWNKGLKLSPQSEETKLKRAISLKGQKRSDISKIKMSLAAKGKKKSDIHKKNLSSSADNQKFSVSQIDKNGIVVNTFESISMAAKLTGFSKSQIADCAKGTRNVKSVRGYIFKYN